MAQYFSDLCSAAKTVFVNLAKKRKFQLLALIFLGFASSLTEAISLGLVIPFINAILSGSEILKAPILVSLFRYFDISENANANLISILATLFILSAVLSTVLRLIVLWFSIFLGNSIGADISVEIFKKTIHQSYIVHVGRNSSEIISGISHKVGVLTNVFTSFVTLITSGLIFLGITSALLIIDAKAALAAFFVFGAVYYFVAICGRKSLIENSIIIAREQTKSIKILQESLGSIRDIIIGQYHNFFTKIYKESTENIKKSAIQNNFLNQSPRFILEGFSLFVIGAYIYVLNSYSLDIKAQLPVLAGLAYGGQKLLPLLQQMYANWSGVVSNKQSLIEVIELLQQTTESSDDRDSRLIFHAKIDFQNVSFKYPGSEKNVFTNFNFLIHKGDKVGIYGGSGSGKSTFVDLLMGFLYPTSGQIMVDDIVLDKGVVGSWRSNIAHVPQSIFLLDATIKENIAFGIPYDLIDSKKIYLSAENAKINSFIEGLPMGYQQVVGERGAKLSGGQKQRIAIARALYKNSNLLVLDEFTSALDDKIALELVNLISELDPELTIVIISHNLNILKGCNKFLDLTQ